jgi:hypothetical protein
MSDLTWYRVPDEKLRPGDIFRFAPALRAAKAPLRIAGRQITGKGGVKTHEVLEHPTFDSVASSTQRGGETTLFLPGRLTLGIVLSRGCEIDKGRLRQVAQIRPLAELQGDGQRAAHELQADLIDGKMFAAHYLPEVPAALGSHFPDSYVDFRYICTLDNSLLDPTSRLVSLSRDALHQLYFGWLRHTTGAVPEPSPCPKCNQEIPLLVEAPGLLSPPEDW